MENFQISNLPSLSSKVIMAASNNVNLSIFLMSPPPDRLELSKNSSSISSGMLALTPDTFTMGYSKYGLTLNSLPHKVNGHFSSTLNATGKQKF